MKISIHVFLKLNDVSEDITLQVTSGSRFFEH